MAMLKLGHGLRAINGKRGGNVYRNDQRGPHIQKFPRLVHRQPTAGQKNQRGYFAQCVTAWKPLTTTEYFWLWHIYAQQHPITNRLGEYKTLTARHMFFKFNLPRLADSLPIITNPFAMT